MDYTQIDIFTTTQGIEAVGAILLSVGLSGYMIKDAKDFESFLAHKESYWDYVEEDLMALLETETTLTAYLPQDEQGAKQLADIEDALNRLKSLDTENEWGRLSYHLDKVYEEDWSQAWKAYYKPIKVGQRLVVCPSWEEYSPQEGEVIITLDPGMAFGTGTHESTRLCIRLIEKHLPHGGSILDVGCGSGILAVSAALLGASSAVGVDIDTVAVKVAKDNAQRNKVEDSCTFFCGSLADQVKGSFDLVCANIVADVIISFIPTVKSLLKPGGMFLSSGIIDERADEVIAKLKQEGFCVEEVLTEGGWVAIAAKPDEPTA